MINFTSQFAIKTNVSCGDKSLSHRALILAAIADGECRVKNLSPCSDVMSTVRCLRKLGAKITISGNTAHIVPIATPTAKTVLDCNNSGTTARLLAGLCAGLGVDAKFVSDQSLSRRPMARVLQPLSQMGARFATGKGMLFEMLPSRLSGCHVTSDVPSAQVKSAVLLAGLFADGETVFTENVPTRNHTENLLLHTGASLQVHGKEICIQKSRPHSFEISLPNDFSSVAYLIALGLLSGQQKMFRNVCVNERRIGMVKILQKSGAKITFLNNRKYFGEDVADIMVEKSGLSPIFATYGEVCDAIDEIPVLASLAVATKGKHLFCNVSELKHKESDRIQAIIRTVCACGQRAFSEGENLCIESDGNVRQKPHFNALGDHRIAMSQAVLCLAVCGGGRVDNENFDVSFPDFLKAVGVHPLSFAVVGSNVKNSLSPLLMGVLSSRADVCCTYNAVQLPADVSDKKLLHCLDGFDGVNLTMPFKERVASLLGCSAKSVNTVGKNITPTSTDGYGIVRALQAHNVPLQGAKLWIVGAGGGAEACVEQLQKYGCDMQIVNRTQSRADALSRRYCLKKVENPQGVLSFVPECDFEQSLQLPSSVRFVLVSAYMGYSGLKAQALQRGLEFIDGREMLYHQGDASFALWTGKKVQNNFENFQKEWEK